FDEITMWKDWKELIRLCNFVVMTRPGHEIKSPDSIFPADVASLFHYDGTADCFRESGGHSIFFRNLTLLDISSTDIRNRLKTSRSIRYLIPDPVRTYILTDRTAKKTKR
ncbi:MAG TPA: hypothetical protein PLA74_10020, partial [Syntrophales bacterium]|nr:hypothetical protein [Syntrophales bacterium]